MVVIILIAIFLVGCGGNGNSLPDFSGQYGGGQIFLGSNGPGGPWIEIGPTTVQANGSFESIIRFYPPGEPLRDGHMQGVISRQGFVNARSLLSGGGYLEICGGPLKKVYGRAGPGWIVTGTVSVSHYWSEGSSQTYFV